MAPMHRKERLRAPGRQRRNAVSALLCAGVAGRYDGGAPATGSALLSAFWCPTPLTADQHGDPRLAALAARHCPALALSNEHMWPVDVSYSWHDGSDLYAEDGDGERRTVLKNTELRKPELFFPSPADLAQKHYIDSPGAGPQHNAWDVAWRRIQGDEPGTAAYRPTQYVHAFWLNRQLGLLALQYWFFYPFNDWVNRHEGDWEHVVSVFKGPSSRLDPEAFRPVTTFYYFHEWVHEARHAMQLRGATPLARHPIVFVGGQGDLWNLWHCSHRQSGGSYPCMGRFANAGSDIGWLLSPAEHLQSPKRIIFPEDFELTMLPEPEHVSTLRSPHLWWLRWNVFFGQRRIDGNLPLLGTLAMDHPPNHPGQHPDWNMRRRRQLWPERAPQPQPWLLPANVRARLLVANEPADCALG